MRRRRLADRQVADARLHYGNPVVGVYTEYSIELGQTEQHPVTKWPSTPRKARSGTSGHQRYRERPAHLNDLGELRDAFWQDHDTGYLAHCGQTVRFVGFQGRAFGDQRRRRQHGAQPLEELDSIHADHRSIRWRSATLLTQPADLDKVRRRLELDVRGGLGNALLETLVFEFDDVRTLTTDQ